MLFSKFFTDSRHTSTKPLPVQCTYRADKEFLRLHGPIDSHHSLLQSDSFYDGTIYIYRTTNHCIYLFFSTVMTTTLQQIQEAGEGFLRAIQCLSSFILRKYFSLRTQTFLLPWVDFSFLFSF